MSTEEINKKLTLLKEGQSCLIVVSEDNGNTFQYECTFQHSEDLRFTVNLQSPNSVNFEENSYCTFSSSPVLGVTSISCKAKIATSTANMVELIATESYDPAAMRSYFRVNLRVPITLCDAPTLKDGDDSKWQTAGNTVDISRTGTLAIFSDECPQEQNLLVSLKMPDPIAEVSCKARLIRIKRLTKRRWLTALQFDLSNVKACDVITANCLQEQRRQIRENVSVE